MSQGQISFGQPSFFTMRISFQNDIILNKEMIKMQKKSYITVYSNNNYDDDNQTNNCRGAWRKALSDL